MRYFALAILGLVASIAPCAAENYSPAPPFLGWQAPESIPPVFRNHCTSGGWHGAYCADHCGATYQFYYCTTASFGCCHTGLGYCDWNGSLRCAPQIFPPY